MAKHRIFLAAPVTTPAGRAAFRTHILTEVAPALLDAVPAIGALSVNLVDATPAAPPWQRPGEPIAPADPDFDAVIDLHGTPAILDATLARLDDLTRDVARASVRVLETVEKDMLPRLGIGPAPGVKFLALMSFHDDLSAQAARRLWAHHAPLALRVHAGMARYVRDWVETIGPDALPVPRFHGIAELHFPSVETMMTRWFDSEAGRVAIVQDVGHFLARATRLYTTEHVLASASISAA